MAAAEPCTRDIPWYALLSSRSSRIVVLDRVDMPFTSAADSPAQSSQSTEIAPSPHDRSLPGDIADVAQELPRPRKLAVARRSLDGVLRGAGGQPVAAGSYSGTAAAPDAPSTWATKAAAAPDSEYDESPLALPGLTLTDASQRELQQMLASIRDNPAPPPPPSVDGTSCVECADGVRERKMPGCEHIMLCAACADEADAWVRRHPASVRAQAAAQLSRIECGVCAD